VLVADYLCQFSLNFSVVGAQLCQETSPRILCYFAPGKSPVFYQCRNGLRKEKYVSIFPLETGQGSVSPIFYMEKLLYLPSPSPSPPSLSPQPFLHARSLQPFHLRMDHFSLRANLLQLGFQGNTVKKTLKQKISAWSRWQVILFLIFKQYEIQHFLPFCINCRGMKFEKKKYMYAENLPFYMYS
jgi:hypothetical protein